LANGSMSSNTSGEGIIRKELIEKDMVDCMIALPGQLFYTTQIPVCLWFITKSKEQNADKSFRKRRGETLFIDARAIGSMIDRTQKELTELDIAEITNTYHAWRSEPDAQNKEKYGDYEDEAGYCKSASLEEIQKNDFVLTPGRYVGVAEEEDDGLHFEDKMSELTAALKEQMGQAGQLDGYILENLKTLGYE